MNAGAIDLSAAGMRVQRLRMERLASRLSQETRRPSDGAEGAHPFAEMMELIAASRAYAANASAVDAAKTMSAAALRILG